MPLHDHDEHDDPFAAALVLSRRKLKIRAALVALGVALLLVVIWLWPTARKDLVAASPQIEARRAQYCAVFEEIDGQEAMDASGSGQRIVLPGYVWLDAADISSPLDGANADQIELSHLANLCGDSASMRGSAFFTGVFEDLARGPSDPRVDRYERDGVAMALGLLAEFEYLVVFRTDSRADSHVRDGNDLRPGSLSGAAFIYRLADAELIASTAVQVEAPSSALVYVNQGAYGQTRNSDVELSVNANARSYYVDVLANRFGLRGVTLVVRER